MKTYLLEYLDRKSVKHLKAAYCDEKEILEKAKELSLDPDVVYVTVLETFHIDTAVHGKVTGEI